MAKKQTEEIQEVEKPKTLNKLYEEWKVKPIYKKERGDDGTMNQVIERFEKDAQTFIRKTSITPDKADILNSQSENTGVHLFLID